jgi:ABC-2 type transport system ATP-binding protein
MSKNTLAIAVKNLVKTYGSMVAVNNISFEVKKGEIIGFLGPNGAGKSTTIKILCGLLAATSGKVEISGISVASNPNKIKNRIGYMPENNPLPEDMRIIEYLNFRARLKGLSGEEANKRVQEVLELCDLHRKAKSKIISTLSKGFRQRVGIADVLLAEPELVIMDEPTIGLDPHQVLMMRKLLQSLKGQMTFVISSHILAEIEKVCDRVIIINRGSIVASGSSQQLRREFIPVEGVRLTFKGDVKAFISKIQLNEELVRYSKISATSNEETVLLLETYDYEKFHNWLSLEIKHYPAIKLCEFAHLETRLEDIFMAATKRSWDDELGEMKSYLSEIE